LFFSKKGRLMCRIQFKVYWVGWRRKPTLALRGVALLTQLISPIKEGFFYVLKFNIWLYCG
jgi:hypothetical protein